MSSKPGGGGEKGCHEKFGVIIIIGDWTFTFLKRGYDCDFLCEDNPLLKVSRNVKGFAQTFILRQPLS